MGQGRIQNQYKFRMLIVTHSLPRTVLTVSKVGAMLFKPLNFAC